MHYEILDPKMQITGLSPDVPEHPLLLDADKCNRVFAHLIALDPKRSRPVACTLTGALQINDANALALLVTIDATLSEMSNKAASLETRIQDIQSILNDVWDDPTDCIQVNQIT